MYRVNAFRTNLLRIPRATSATPIAVKFSKYISCDTNMYPSGCHFPKDDRPCFDIRNLRIVAANNDHARMIKSFLYNHFWPREPTVAALWMSLHSPYLGTLSDIYSGYGFRTLALEHIKRTNETKMIGLLVANNLRTWAVEELEDWAHTTSEPDNSRMYFFAHCMKAVNLFQKYNVDSIHTIEVLCSAPEVCGHGVATRLLKTAIDQAVEMRFPLVQVISVNHYASKICRKLGMKEEWSMDFDDFVNFSGKRVFYSRTPHTKVIVYTKYNDPKKGIELPCNPQH